MPVYITQDQVDKISDAFQSTFLIYQENMLCNLFFEHEKQTVNDLIKKYVPDVKNILFYKGEEISKKYYSWTIVVEF